MTEIRPLYRSLDQELMALMRCASMECLVCGEFVMTRGGEVSCPECGFRLSDRVAERDRREVQSQAG
jgi:hypothetical protein